MTSMSTRTLVAGVLAWLALGGFSMVAVAEGTTHQQPSIAEFDTNGNGRIDPDETTPAFLDYVNQALMPLVEEPEVQEAPQTAAVASSVAPSVIGSAKSISRITRSLLLWRAVEEVSLQHTVEELDAAEGAMMSYTNDVRQTTEEWQVQGALLYPVRYETGLESNGDARVLSAYTFVPSASFDRKFHSSDVGAEIDNLVFRLGSEWEVSGGRIFPKQYFRMAPVYGTDFSFESSVVAAEFQYEALKEKWGLGAPIPCLMARFKCEWRAILHMEGGKTLDAGDKINLVDDEAFLRIGPKLKLTLQPTFAPVERLEARINWLYLEDILEDNGATDLFEAGISWRLDDLGHLRLRASYRHGDLPLTRDKITIISTGLEVKF